MTPNGTKLRALGAALLVAGIAAGARAADLQVTLPTFTAPPGATVLVPINVSPAPNGLGILSIDLRLTLDPAVIQSSQSLSDGFLQTWGAPYVNATSSFVAEAAAGSTPVTSTQTLLNTVQLVIKAGAVIGTDMPLQFQHILFNEGTPSVAVTNGLLRIRSGGVDVPRTGPLAFALEPVSPNPAARIARFAFSLGGTDAAGVNLEIFTLDGRRVVTLAAGELPAGRHERTWDLRESSGRRVAPGVYFVRLECGGRHLQRRMVVVS